MIVKYFDLKKNIIQNKKFFLLYGKNEGLIEETIKNSLKPILPKNVFNYEEKEILDNIEIHFVENASEVVKKAFISKIYPYKENSKKNIDIPDKSITREKSPLPH